MKAKPKRKAPAKPAEPEFTFVLDEADFNELIYEPMWTIDYIANVFRDMEYKPAQAAIRLLDEAYRGFEGYFGSDGGLMDRPQNKQSRDMVLSIADVAAYREKLSPMFELIDLTKDMDTEDDLYQAISILRIMGGFFDRTARELDGKLAEAKKEEGAA